MNEACRHAACPCGSGRAYTDCCGRWLSGEPAPTPEALMRSRYTAYSRGDEGYLLASWHPSTRPGAIDIRGGPVWIGLAIRGSGGGEARGTVEFVARWRDGDRVGELHETSRFVREGGRWYYVDGQVHPSGESRVGRNSPCPCGSGKKFKRCCGASGR